MEQALARFRRMGTDIGTVMHEPGRCQMDGRSVRIPATDGYTAVARRSAMEPWRELLSGPLWELRPSRSSAAHSTG